MFSRHGRVWRRNTFERHGVALAARRRRGSVRLLHRRRARRPASGGVLFRCPPGARSPSAERSGHVTRRRATGRRRRLRRMVSERRRRHRRPRGPRTESSVRSPRGGPDFLDLLDRSQHCYSTGALAARAGAQNASRFVTRAPCRDGIVSENRRRGRPPAGRARLAAGATFRVAAQCLSPAPRVPPPPGRARASPLFSRSSLTPSAPRVSPSVARRPLPGPAPVAVPRRLGDRSTLVPRRAVADVVRRHPCSPSPAPTAARFPAIFDSRSCAWGHVRAAPRAARGEPRRRALGGCACSSSGPSARDDRGAADQGASRAPGVAACAAGSEYGGARPPAPPRSNRAAARRCGLCAPSSAASYAPARRSSSAEGTATSGNRKIPVVAWPSKWERRSF